MISDGILKKLDGTYSVAVIIQDGIERKHEIQSLAEAIKNYKEMHLAWNNNQNVKPKLYEEKQTIQTQIFQVE